jgi:hypothetical protein
MEAHQELHRECDPVPLLGHYAIKHILRRVKPIGDPQKDLDELCFAIERAWQVPRARPMEERLGLLAIDALQAQIPFIVNSQRKIIDLSERRIT